MRPAFLVSDDDIRSLRTQPWFIELSGEAVFMHDSILRLLQQQQPLMPNVNGAYDTKGRSLTCDQPNCYRNLAENKFINYAARQMHRATAHGIPGEFAAKHRKYPRKLPAPQGKLPPPMATTSTQVAINRLKPASYQYTEFDAKGICGIGECDYKPTGKNKVRALHFHRSVKHGIRGINWNRASHIKARGKMKVGRPRKEAVTR